MIAAMPADASPRTNALAFFDLEAAAAAIEAQGSHRELIGKIRNWAAAHSAVLDLKRAERLIKTILSILATANETGPIESDNDKHYCAGAVFEAAILAYTRATHTTSEVRHRTPIADRLPPDLKLAHLRLADLRDHAIAHHGRAEWAISRAWADEVSVFSTYASHIEVDYFSNRANWMGSAAYDLAVVVPAALQVGERLTLERSEELLAALKQHESDPEWNAALEASPFKPSAYFRNDRAIADFFERKSYADRIYSRIDPHATDISGRNAWQTPKSTKRRK
jgi:hypothetical protein